VHISRQVSSLAVRPHADGYNDGALRVVYSVLRLRLFVFQPKHFVPAAIVIEMYEVKWPTLRVSGITFSNVVNRGQSVVLHSGVLKRHGCTSIHENTL
jgi:hypothetical protein